MPECIEMLEEEPDVAMMVLKRFGGSSSSSSGGGGGSASEMAGRSDGCDTGLQNAEEEQQQQQQQQGEYGMNLIVNGMVGNTANTIMTANSRSMQIPTSASTNPHNRMAPSNVIGGFY